MNASTLIVIAFALAAPGPKDGKGEPAKLEGDWIVEKYIQGGKEEKKRKGAHFSFKDGFVFVQEEGNKGITFKVDEKASPAKLDIGDAMLSIPGIYKIEGNVLTICFLKGGKNENAERPKTFESPEGSKLVIMILKREKK